MAARAGTSERARPAGRVRPPYSSLAYHGHGPGRPRPPAHGTSHCVGCSLTLPTRRPYTGRLPHSEALTVTVLGNSDSGGPPAAESRPDHWHGPSPTVRAASAAPGPYRTPADVGPPGRNPAELGSGPRASVTLLVRGITGPSHRRGTTPHDGGLPCARLGWEIGARALGMAGPSLQWDSGYRDQPVDGDVRATRGGDSVR